MLNRVSRTSPAPKGQEALFFLSVGFEALGVQSYVIKILSSGYLNFDLVRVPIHIQSSYIICISTAIDCDCFSKVINT